MTAEQLTEVEKFERLEQIAAEAGVDTSDPTEPLEELLKRIRVGLQDRLDTLSDRFEEFHVELDEIEAELAEQNDPDVSAASDHE
jgi:hypothetical protein